MAQNGPRMTQNDPKWPKNDARIYALFSANFFTEKAVPKTFSLLECMLGACELVSAKKKCRHGETPYKIYNFGNN